MYPIHPKSSTEKFYSIFSEILHLTQSCVEFRNIFHYLYLSHHITTYPITTHYRITSHCMVTLVTIRQTLIQLSRFCWPWAVTEISEDRWRPKLPNTRPILAGQHLYTASEQGGGRWGSTPRYNNNNKLSLL